MIGFEIITKTNYGEYRFYVNANNGKDALKTLIKRSYDFNNILKKRESNNMNIVVRVDK